MATLNVKITQLPELKHSGNELNQLKRFLTKTIGNELSNIHNACYMPKMIHYFNDIKQYTGLSVNDIKVFLHVIPKEYGDIMATMRNEITASCIISILYYSRNNYDEIAKLFYYLLSIRLYANVVHKQWKLYCKQDIWDNALIKLSQKHLFKVHKGISNTVLYLATIEYTKNKTNFKNKNVYLMAIIAALYMLRHRLNQSVKSFSQRYYALDEELKEKGSVSAASAQQQEDSVADSMKIIEFITNSMCAYKQIDNKAELETIKSTGMNRATVNSIIKSISSVEYKEKIKFILILINRILPIKSLCLQTKRNQMSKKIVLGLKTDKYIIKDEIMDLIKSTDAIYDIMYVPEQQVVLCFCTYLFNFIKNKIC